MMVKSLNRRTVYAVVAGLMLSGQEALAAVELSEVKESAIELGAFIFGGIGIFLIGIHFAGGHLQKMSGGKFQALIGRLSGSAAGIAGSGVALGFVTQSGKAAAFILADFVQAGMMRVRDAAPIVLWANAGCSLIVFASMVSLKVLALFVLGITALGLTFHIPKKLVNAYGALFGLAMIMYGLYLVKAGAAGYASAQWVSVALQGIADHYMIALLLGCVMTLLVQSNLAILMIAIALASAGLFNLEETAMVMFGAQAGTGILTYIFSFHAHGRARQVVASQIAFDSVATLVFVVLFYIETWFGIPLILAAARSVSSDVGTQAVVLALLFQVGAAVILTLLRKPVWETVRTWFPPSAAEVLGKPQYLHERAADSPETALLLIEKEQFRLLERLPICLAHCRGETLQDGHDPAAYHEAFKTISTLIGETLSKISGREISQATSDDLIRTTKLEEQLVSLESLINELASQPFGDFENPRAETLGRNIVESLDFMILTAIDAFRSRSDDDIETLELLTEDRSEMMTRIRHNYFESEKELSTRDRNFILDTTILFENAVHALGRCSRLLRQAS